VAPRETSWLRVALGPQRPTQRRRRSGRGRARCWGPPKKIADRTDHAAFGVKVPDRQARAIMSADYMRRAWHSCGLAVNGCRCLASTAFEEVRSSGSRCATCKARAQAKPLQRRTYETRCAVGSQWFGWDGSGVSRCEPQFLVIFARPGRQKEYCPRSPPVV
jgi:hypothetical protein